MPDRQALEALLLANLPLVDRICAAVCRRHSLAGEAAADFGSWVRLSLVERDYAILGKYRGESSLATYLTVVVAMLFREYRVQRWGRWRPSAAAKRRGLIAVRLETLTSRDGLGLDQAAQVLRSSGDTALSDRELGALLASLPRRSPLRPIEVGDEPLADAAAGMPADELVTASESNAQHHALGEALMAALRQLPPEDLLITRMHYWEGMGIADIARALSLPQKPLYRRLERSLAELRRLVEQAGFTREHAQAVLDEATA